MRRMDIKTDTDDKGRTRYTVGPLVTYDAQEAIDLTQTGVFKIACPLTRRAIEPAAGHEMYAALTVRHVTPLAHGFSGTKFPWE